MVLALIFETETPFSTIRTQAGYLARALALPPGAALPPYPKAANAITVSASVSANNSYPVSPQLPPLLEDVPPPTPRQREKLPEKMGANLTWFEEASVPASLTEASKHQQTHVKSANDQMHQPSEGKPETVVERIAPASPAVKPPASPEKANNLRTAPSQPGEPRISPENNLTAYEKPNMPPKLLPASPTLHYLTYSCTLLPRLPQHQLGGDLALRLREWMPKLFLAFGWQLLQVSISPEYLIAIARVEPNTAPGSLVRIIRQQTSRRIFATYPRFAIDNPSNDFWAPGYLILSNSQPPPNHIIRHFIEQTRLQQGASIDG
jgi:REP element-mobilizing transposase RayT